MLRVGHAAARLEVARGASLAGYAARTGPHGTVSGELHPLEVGAVALVASQTAVVVVADLLQVDDDLALAVRTHVAEATGTSPDLVWVCATHTHSGPFPQEIRLARVAAEAATSAVAGARPATVSLHRGTLHGVGGQRTGSDRRTTVPVDVLAVREGRRLAGLVGVVPVHPTVLGADNTLVSPDLPGAVRRSLAPSVWSLVATGAAGDVSTRSHRHEQTGAEVDRLGLLTARAIRRAVSGPALAEATDVVSGAVTTLELVPADPQAPYRQDALGAARRVLASAEATGDPRRIRDASVALQGAELAASVSNAEPVPCATSYLDLGGPRLLGLGGEPFLDLAPGGTDVLVGYANGYAGYLPTQAAFDAATAHPDHPEYEILISRVAPGQPEHALRALTRSP
jgi:hypothetical protein